MGASLLALAKYIYYFLRFFLLSEKFSCRLNHMSSFKVKIIVQAMC